MSTDTASETTGAHLTALQDFMSRPRAGVRSRVMELLAEETFRPGLEITREEYRARALEAVRRLGDEGLGSIAFPAAYGGGDDPGAAIAVFETLAFGDTSIVVKYGVQYGLFAGSIYQLGTELHHRRYLADAGSLALPGGYAMTEIGHGSNVRGLETTATWDGETGEFVIHSPHESAGKEWIGNAALHARMATVFAQLHVGGVNRGVHALLVPIRDAAGDPLPGIRIEDNGPKVGLNGVDNGRIWFDRVRVPRENLLNRFASVSADGEYTSPVASDGKRFFTMLGTLVAGRISIAAAAVSIAKTGLTIATRYSDRRAQFGPRDEPEVPILDFAAQQRLLLPRIATTYGLHFAVRDLVETYAGLVGAQQASGELPGDEMAEVESRSAGLKAMASWHANETLQAARESMGGRGYHAANRLGRLRADADIFATFEGANVVLLQLVAKALLTQFKEEMGDLNFIGAVRYVAERAGQRVTELNPVVTRRSDPEHLRSPDVQLAAFEYREQRLLTSAARRLKKRLDGGMDPFSALNECQGHLMVLARAHGERIVLEAFQDAVARAPTPGVSEQLSELAALYALWHLEADRAWFLEAGYMEPSKSRAIRREVDTLCAQIRPEAVTLVDGWGVPDEVLQSRDGQSRG
jgi:acyl-CoA oxidase